MSYACPKHHIMVGAALLTAYKNVGGDIDFSKALTEMKKLIAVMGNLITA